ncbi:hypothetical protein Clacol_001446 [Clathrus columnatus]|uniref:NmrA-like domain-containing protein n=1 Tax=Clathrus columnatus TaxID=1419009 RepID=A0AAV4ZY95_9AGAM|nr:hypothetical protein Clacol_001446 [Clathrus columnatus]
MSDNYSKLKVVLTGTTGNLGSSVLKHLLKLEHVPKSSIMISLYNPSKKPEGVEEGLEIREGNYEDPESLDKAYNGADILFLMSYPSLRYQIRIDAHRNAIEAAKRSSIKHIIYTSLAFAGSPTSSESVAAVMQAHLYTEAYLKSNLPPSITYTSIREGLYTESFPLYFGIYDISSKPSEVSIPPGDNDKLIAFTKRDELGEATAKIIQSFIDGIEGNEFVNRTVLLSAEPKYSLRSLGELIGKILDTPPVTIKYIPPEEYAASEAKASIYIGTPEMAKAWTTTYPAIGKGEASFTGEGSLELERIIGRKPEAVEITLARILKNIRF